MTVSPSQVDAVGTRYAAALTTVVLAAALVTLPLPMSTGLIILQGLVFASGAFLGPRFQPYGWLFRTFIRPKLSTAPQWEDSQPPRFAQLVGVIFVAVAGIGLATGVTLVAQVAVGLAMAAAFLNAAFGYCLGCEIYLLGRRLTR